MSKLFGSLAGKLTGLLAVVLFVIGFKESILTDDSVSAAFEGFIEVYNGYKEALLRGYAKIRG